MDQTSLQINIAVYSTATLKKKHQQTVNNQGANNIQVYMGK